MRDDLTHYALRITPVADSPNVGFANLSATGDHSIILFSKQLRKESAANDGKACGDSVLMTGAKMRRGVLTPTAMIDYAVIVEICQKIRRKFGRNQSVFRMT